MIYLALPIWFAIISCMNPKKLKFPFKWEERKPLIHENVLFVPHYYEKHHELSLFERKAPLFIEYCSGNGDWVIERAKNAPHENWIAVEKRFDRVRKIWSKMRNQQVENMLIVCGEALTFSRYYLPAESADGVYVNFPDPWPKHRHAKHRLIQASFIEELVRIIKKEGSAVYATDDSIYRDQMLLEMSAYPQWQNSLPAPFYQTEWEDYGSSWFEQLWTSKGRTLYFMQFQKK